VPYFYSKGGAVTIVAEDLPHITETMKNVLKYFKQVYPYYKYCWLVIKLKNKSVKLIRNKLNNIIRFSGNLLGQIKKVFSVPTYKYNGNKPNPDDIKEFSKVHRDDNFKEQREELIKVKAKIYQKHWKGVSESIEKNDPDRMINADASIEGKLNEIEEILNNMGDIMEAHLTAQKVRNTAVIMGSLVLLYSAPPSLPLLDQSFYTLDQPLNIQCFVDFETLFHLFEVFKLKYQKIDCGPIVVYIGDKDTGYKTIERMVELGVIKKKDAPNIKQMLREAFEK